jgi:hypothetical protein
VVGVDSRWLLHSLRQHASVFKASNEALEGMDEEEQFHWESTPFNYLEKIFQIPFNLRPIDQKGFVRLIDDLTTPKPIRPVQSHEIQSAQPKPADTTEQAEPNPAVAAATVDQATQVARQGPQTETTTPTIPDAIANVGQPTPPPQSEPPEIDPNPPFLDLTEAERTFMHRMHSLIPTPRAAKRYVNVYRLLRASLAEDARKTLEQEGENRCYKVLLLLAILTGFPQEGAVLLRELLEREPDGNWWDFVDALASEYIDAVPKPNKPDGATAAQAENRQRAQRWEDLRGHLNGVRPELADLLGDHLPCTEFTAWARLVARYSFESGRVLQVVRA